MVFIPQKSDQNYIENGFIMQNVSCAMSEMFNDAMKQLELGLILVFLVCL